MKYVIRIIGPVGLFFFLNASIDSTATVNLDPWSGYIFLALCLPFAFVTTRAGLELSHEINWPVLTDDTEREHWLARLCARLDHRGLQFARRWLCWLASHWVSYSSWPHLYRQGLEAAIADSDLERYFAERLYRFDNALDALHALEILQRHGIEPGPHPNLQVQVFIARANSEISDTIVPGVDPQPVTIANRSLALRRNPIIRLFEGADPANSPVWKSAESQAAKSPTEPPASTAVLFATPMARSVPFTPVRLQTLHDSAV